MACFYGFGWREYGPFFLEKNFEFPGCAIFFYCLRPFLL